MLDYLSIHEQILYGCYLFISLFIITWRKIKFFTFFVWIAKKERKFQKHHRLSERVLMFWKIATCFHCVTTWKLQKMMMKELGKKYYSHQFSHIFDEKKRFLVLFISFGKLQVIVWVKCQASNERAHVACIHWQKEEVFRNRKSKILWEFILFLQHKKKVN